MPVPTPKTDEKESDFVSRWMKDKKMVSEFTDQKQRVAVCYSQWRKMKEIKKQTEEFLKLMDQKLKKLE